KIDAAPRRHLPQPEDEMRPRLDRAQAPEHLQKDFLRQLLGAPAVVEEMERDAEDHRLVLLDQLRERIVIAAPRAIEHVVGDREREDGRHSTAIYGEVGE